MGTHPIFESDFDCLTELSKIGRGIRISRHLGVTFSQNFVKSRKLGHLYSANESTLKNFLKK